MNAGCCAIVRARKLAGELTHLPHCDVIQWEQDICLTFDCNSKHADIEDEGWVVSWGLSGMYNGSVKVCQGFDLGKCDHIFENRVNVALIS